jgi:hypothetical protein
MTSDWQKMSSPTYRYSLGTSWVGGGGERLRNKAFANPVFELSISRSVISWTKLISYKKVLPQDNRNFSVKKWYFAENKNMNSSVTRLHFPNNKTRNSPVVLPRERIWISWLQGGASRRNKYEFLRYVTVLPSGKQYEFINLYHLR